MNYKKAIGPVVAVALLLVVAVTAVVGFQTWFQSYSSGLYTKAESQDLSDISGVENVVGDELFFKNDGEENISVDRVVVGDNDCNIKTNISKGIQSINLGTCLENKSGSTEVVVYTDDKIYSKDVFVEGKSTSNSISSCYKSSNVSTIGNESPCTDMLIVNDSMLRGSASSQIGGDESYSITGPDANTYTFANSTYNVFTGQVTNMSELFYGTSFNSNINYWNTFNVEDMGNMFYSASSFNQSLSKWDTSNVENMEKMFSLADSFNNNVSSWDVSNVKDMEEMFGNSWTYEGGVFNSDISEWNISNVKRLDKFLAGQENFNQNLSKWNVESVETFSDSFRNTNINFDMSSWEIKNANSIRRIFMDAKFFNQSINHWNISNMTQLNGVFSGATSFNQPLDNWKTSNVTQMQSTFRDAESFNQNLSMWNVSQVEFCGQFDDGTTSWTKPKPSLSGC